MPHYKKIKIISDGSPRNTKVLIDGEEAKLPISDFQLTLDQNGAQAVLTLFAPELELELDERQVHFVIQRPGAPKEAAKFLGRESAPGPK